MPEKPTGARTDAGACVDVARNASGGLDTKSGRAARVLRLVLRGVFAFFVMGGAAMGGPAAWIIGLRPGPDGWPAKRDLARHVKRGGRLSLEESGALVRA